ncbi:ABC transporter substrate-binding protein [Streptomyces sp. NPDC057580]|uniref:ABC transporter substrate-binding protein n=1 Tax=Streptomyces sp. NPDC057580 TaxID=3346173 RepID=UPI0036C63544
MQQRIHHAAGATICALAILAAAACAPDSGPAEDSQDVRGVLRLGHQLGVSTWDPATSVGGSETRLLNLVHDRLVHLTPDGTLAPGLASSWRFNKDGTELTLELRPRLTFSDDTPIDADVVKANLDRARTKQGSTLKAGLSGVTGVQAVDGDTVRITLKEADTSLPALLSERFGMIVKVGSADSAYPDPVGTATSGMFRVTRNQTGVSFALKRNATFWDAASTELSGVEVTVLKDATARLNALRSGQADLTLVDPDQLEEAESLPSVKVLPTTTFNLAAVWLNSKLIPEFDDPRVRRALNLATDRRALVEGIALGYAEPASQPYPKGYYAHNEAYEFPYDPATARKLIADAGVTGLEVPFVVTSPLAKTAEALQDQWKKVGIKLDVRPLAGFGVAEQLWQRKTAPAGMAPYTGRPDPAIVFSMFHLPGQPTNPGDIVDPDITELVGASKAEQDAEKRAHIFRQIAQASVERPQGVIPLYFPQEGVVFRDSVKGIRPWLDGFPDLENVRVSR